METEIRKQAFPSIWDKNHIHNPLGEDINVKGMDLVDYYAAKALQALMTNQRNFDYVPGGKDRKKVLNSLVEDSYAVANAMMEYKIITTYENQPIQEFAKQVAKTVLEDWGSHNIDEFIEMFKKEVGR